MKDKKNNKFPFRKFSVFRKSSLIKLGVTIAFSFLSLASYTQDDTSRVEKVKAFFKNDYHSPGKATAYSAILPGWGQAYNRKYWKLPIVYAGFGVAGYFVKTNNDQYQLYKSDYKLLEDDPNAQTVSGLPKQQIRINIDSYRRTRDLSIFGMIAWYGLVMIDANVDGHFFNYDVDEDLSMGIQPWIGRPDAASQGLGISLNFKFR